MQTITTLELRKILTDEFDGLLIDVRQPDEHAACNLPEAKLIPLSTLPAELDSLPKDQEIYVHCKAGGRSAKAVEFLMDHGFTQVTNIAGGMDAWLKEE